MTAKHQTSTMVGDVSTRHRVPGLQPESPYPSRRPGHLPANRQSSIGNRQFSSGFTLVELLAMIFILAVIVTITGVLLRETRLTANRLTENEESSYSASRTMELLRRDVEHAVADSSFSNFVFVATNADVDTSLSSLTDPGVGPTTNSMAMPGYSNSTRICMIVLDDETNGPASKRAMSEVFYWLAASPTSACASLVRAEIRLDANSTDGAYTDPLWYRDAWTNAMAAEVVARYVTDFSVQCTGRDRSTSANWTTNELPAWIDVSLSYLPESAARRLYAHNALTNQTEVAKVLTTVSCRVFLPNRRGYMDGK